MATKKVKVYVCSNCQEEFEHSDPAINPEGKFFWVCPNCGLKIRSYVAEWESEEWRQK